MRKAGVLSVLFSVVLLAVAIIAEAQQPKTVPRIGFLAAASPSLVAARTEAFRQGQLELRYVDGKNIVIEYRYSEGKLESLSEVAAELVGLKAIYYTTDGSTPTQSSVLYSGAMTLSNSTTVKAKAFKSGYNGSSENSASFTIAAAPPPPTSGNAYYVANNGSDSYSCTQARSASTPKRTIGAGLACVGSAGTEAGAGYTVQVAAGTYADSIVDKIPSGSGSSNPFTLQCATDFACILSPGGTTAAIGINTPTHWITVRGFKTTTGGGWYLSASNAARHHHISFINNEWVGNTMHSAAMGIQASGTDTLTVRGNRIYGLNGGSGYSHAIYAADSTTNWTIEDNDIHDNGAYGIHLYGTGSTLPSGFIIRRNRTYRNGTPNVNGTGIITYGPGHQIYNNVVYSNLNEGILVRAVSGTVLVYNNTVYANSRAGISNESGLTVICRNNLAISNGGAQVSGCTTSSNNTTSGTAASYFVDAAGGNFTLASGSPAIDVGTSTIASGVTVSYNGSAPDTGAYER